MATVKLSEQEAMEALFAALPQRAGTPEARTSGELAELMGLSVYQVTKALRALDKQGRVEFHSVIRPALGRVCRVQAYVILPTKKR